MTFRVPRSARRVAALLVAAGLVATFFALDVWGFSDPNNLMKLLADVALIAIPATGMAALMASGGIDLSVGSLLALAGACGVAAARAGAPAPVAILAAVALGAALGTLNGTVTVLTRVHPLVVTAVALVAYRVAFLALLGGEGIDGVPHRVLALARGRCLGVQGIVWAAAVCVAGGAVFLHRYADAPRTQRFSVVAFALCGGAVGLTGVLWTAEYNAVRTDLGRMFELPVIAAAALGGASPLRRRASAAGTAAAALLIGVMFNGMAVRGIPSTLQAVVFGALAFGALVVNPLLRWLAAARRARTGRRGSR